METRKLDVQKVHELVQRLWWRVQIDIGTTAPRTSPTGPNADVAELAQSIEDLKSLVPILENYHKDLLKSTKD